MPVSSWVNSVEFINATISGANNSASYSLSKGQNYTNCVPFFTVCGDSVYYDNRLTDVTFSGTTNSGIIRFDRSNNRATTNYIKCYVVEFNPEQVRVQQGTFSLNGTTTQTVTLPTTVSGVDRAAMTFSWKSDNTSQHQYNSAVRGRVISNSSIDLYRYGSSNNCSGHWFLFEDLGNNFRVNHLSGTQNAGQTIDINGQEVVDPLRTFVLGSYANDSVNVNPYYYTTRIFLYSIGTVRSDKNSGSYTSYWAAQVVKILDQTKIYVPMDHALFGWTTPATYNRNVAGVSGRVPLVCNTATSTVVSAGTQGFSRVETSDVNALASAMVASEITASGTMTHTKFGTTYASNPSYTVAVDWAGIDISIGSNSSPIPKGNGPNQSFVKSVENFRFTLQGNLGVYVLTKGQTVSNCAAFSSCRSSTVDLISTILVNVYIIEPGLVYMQHWNDTEQVVVDVSIVEFYPDQVRVQQKTVNITASATTTNISINSVSSVDKAFILSNVFTSYGGGVAGFRYSLYRVQFTSTTNVELYKCTAGYETTCTIFVVEDLGSNFITKHTTSSFSSYDNFYDDSYNWGIHNSFPIVSFTGDAVNDYPYFASVCSTYVSEHRLIYAVKANGSYTIYWAGTIVKFLDNKRHTLPIYATMAASPATVTGYYNSEIRNTENITAYNVVQYSTAYCNTSDSSGTSDAFATITIKNYNTGEYEISKGGTSYGITYGMHIINWPGYHYQDANNVFGTRTKSFINSIQKNLFVSDGGLLQVWLKHNQDATKCVPFISNSVNASDGYIIRYNKVVYKYTDPDCFRIRSGNQTSTRRVISYIVEFNQNIKVQYGEGCSSGTSKTFNIDEVNLSRAFLHFYTFAEDGWGRSLNCSAVCGYFSSSSQLTFVRNSSSSGRMSISWYVVECPDWGKDSYWTVYRSTTGVLSGTTVYSWLPVQPAIERTLFSVSYSSNEVNGYPYFGTYRIFNRQDHGIQFDKGNGSYDIVASNVEAVEFSPSLVAKDLKVYSNFYTFNSASTNMSIDLKLNSYDTFHIQRSMLLNAHHENISRADTSDYVAFQECYHCLEFNNTVGSGYSNAITASRTTSNYTSYGYYYAIQFPRFNKYYFSGYVKEQGSSVSRKVSAYKSSSGEIVDTTMSASGTGYFYLETPDYVAHHIVASGNDEGTSYNDLIYSKIYPTVISGAFAWIADYPTVSGVGELVV